jgi:hypothetical protein
MKLERVRTLAPVRLVGRVPGALHETLTAYARYYREEHGEGIDLWPLVVQMLRVFLDDDRLFQTWRRHSNGASTADRSEPAGVTRVEARNG